MKKGFEKKKIDTKSVLERAKELLKARSYRKAIEELEKAKIRSVDYYLLLASAYEGLGDTERAERYFEEARFLDTELKSREKLRKGISLASSRNFRAAERELLESIRLNPFGKDAYVELYKLYKRTGNYTAMIKILRTLMMLEPYDTFPYLELSKLYKLRKQHARAVRILKFALDIFDDPELRFELGETYAEMGLAEEAVEELSQACYLDPANVEYRKRLIEILAEKGDYETAIDVVLSALKFYPGAIHFIHSLAWLYDLAGKEEIAEYYYRLAVSKSKGFLRDDSLRQLFEFFLDRGRYDQAEETLRELLSSTSNAVVAVDAFLELASILADQERYRDIVEVGEKLMKEWTLLGEDFCDVAEVVALALFREGRFQESMDLYRMIVARSQDERQVKRSYTKLKEVEEVLSLERMLYR